MRLTMTRAVSGLSRDAIHWASAKPPARRAPVLPRDDRRGIAIGRDGQEAGRHLRAGAERIASDQQVARRCLIWIRAAFIQERARLVRRDPAFRTPDDLVAGAVRGEPVIAVGDDLGQRRSGRPLFLERLDLFHEHASLLGLVRRQRSDDPLPWRIDRQHLGSQQLLTGGPLRLRFHRRPLDVLGKPLLDQLDPEPFAMRRLDVGDLVPQRLYLLVDLGVRGAIRCPIRAIEQRVVDLDITEDRRLHAVVVLLQDRVELVVVDIAHSAPSCRARRAPASRARHRDSRGVAPGCPSRGTARADPRGGNRWRCGSRRSCGRARRPRSAP